MASSFQDGRLAPKRGKASGDRKELALRHLTTTGWNMTEKVTETRRNEAWIGDAVLTLFVRDWLLTGLTHSSPDRNALHEHFTSNQFLSAFGEPTLVEAEIGRIYLHTGLEAAFNYIRTRLLGTFVRSARKRGLRVDAPGEPPGWPKFGKPELT